MQSQSEPTELQAWISRHVQANGPVTFAQFMEWALYHPQWGYYTCGPNIGPRGDFTTSPEASPVFGRLLGHHIADIHALLDEPASMHVVEYGPGRGTLADHLLRALQQDFPQIYKRLTYHLVEVSPALEVEQRTLLEPFYSERLMWHKDTATLPAGLVGAIIANEVVDAFPVHVVRLRSGTLAELFVAASGDGELTEVWLPPSTPELELFLNRYDIDLAEGETIEINLAGAGWLGSLSEVLARGVVTIIDYGDTQPARYSSSRRQGTLLGYGSGKVTDSLLAAPGRQDLTALVDFTHLTDAAKSAGFEVVATTRQAAFLAGLGLGSTVLMEAPDTSGPDEKQQYKAGAQSLVSMEGLGRFHVLVLLKGVDAARARAGLSGVQYAGIL